jgi:glycosyltransferase involved in cell wall biosynthesis
MVKSKILIINYPSSTKDFRLIILNSALQKLEFDTQYIVNPIWGDYEKKVLLTKKPYLLLKEIFAYCSYLFKLALLITKNRFDFIFVGYPAFIEILFLKICFVFSKKRKTIITDFFISIYDTVVLDRKKINEKSFLSKFLFCTDKALLKISSKVITDSNANSKRFSIMFNVPEHKFNRIIVGSKLSCGETNLIESITDKNELVRIGWVGAFIPLHGIEKILSAANLIQNKKIEFHLIGDGPEQEVLKLTEKIKALKLQNIILHGELSYADSMNFLYNCDICLGIFGESVKAKSVIPFKVFDYLYLNKYIITQHSEALNELPVLNNIHLVENTPEAIAEAIDKAILETTFSGTFSNYKVINHLQTEDIKKVFYERNR